MEANDSNIQHILNVNRLIHEPARVAIMSLLSVVEEADFLFIMNKTGLTQGNLSSHLAKLEAADYIKIRKAFKGKRPITFIKISELGRSVFDEYLISLKQFIGGI